MTHENLLPIQCPDPDKRQSLNCGYAGGGSVELTNGAPVALSGPLPHPVYIIPCEAIRVYVVCDDGDSRAFDLSPFSLLALSKGLTRASFCGDAEVILIAANPEETHKNLLESCHYTFEQRNQEICSAARMLRKHLLSSNKPSATYLGACVHLISYHVSEQISCEQDRRHRNTLVDHDWNRVLQLIEDRLDRSITVAELSDSLGISPSQCSRIFKATMGYPPQEYIRERKVQRARELLVNTRNSLADIALASGFCSQAHMTNTFSRILGVTPRRYRADGREMPSSRENMHLSS